MSALTKDYNTRTETVLVPGDPVWPGMGLEDIGEMLLAEAAAMDHDAFYTHGQHKIAAWINNALHVMYKVDVMAYHWAHPGGHIFGVKGYIVDLEMIYIDSLYHQDKVTVVSVVDPNYGWNAGAFGTETLDALYGEYAFEAKTSNIGAVTGLSSVPRNIGVTWNEIEWAIYTQNGLFAVAESGTLMTAWAPFASTDTFAIRRLNRTIQYLHNGIVFYTSTQACTYPALVVDAALYAGGDAIVNAVLRGVEQEGGTLLLPALEVSDGTFGAGVTLMPLNLHGDDAGVVSVAFLPFVEVQAEGDLQVQGNGDVILRPMNLVGWQTGGGSAEVELLPIGLVETPVSEDMAAGRMPSFKLTAQVRGDETALIGTLPGLALESYTAGRMQGVMPSMRLDSTVSGDSYDTLIAAMPAFTLTAEILTGSNVEVRGTLPLGLRLEASTGAVMEGALALPSGHASGVSGSLVAVRATFPALILEAEAIAEQYARMVGTLPLFQMIYGEVLGQLPPFAGFAQVKGPDPEKAVWVTNVRVEEMTRYTGYDFLAIGRLGGSLYGVKSDGLYRLGGDKDQGTAVLWRFVTHPNDFGTDHHKRVPYLYLGNARGVQVRPTCDEELVGAYDSIDGRQRVRLARGKEGRYWSFDVRPAYDQPAKVDGFEPLIEQLARRV